MLRIVHIIDGMATIQMMKSGGTTTYGELTMKYFTSIVSPYHRATAARYTWCLTNIGRHLSRVKNARGEDPQVL